MATKTISLTETQSAIVIEALEREKRSIDPTHPKGSVRLLVIEAILRKVLL